MIEGPSSKESFCSNSSFSNLKFWISCLKKEWRWENSIYMLICKTWNVSFVKSWILQVVHWWWCFIAEVSQKHWIQYPKSNVLFKNQIWTILIDWSWPTFFQRCQNKDLDNVGKLEKIVILTIQLIQIRLTRFESL